MAIGRDLEASRSRVKFPLYEFLETTARLEPVGTRDIVDELECSYETCYKKLCTLRDLDVLESQRIGNAFQWSVNTSSEFEPTSKAEIEGETIAGLLQDAITTISESIINDNNLEASIPDELEEWLVSRGIDSPKYSAQVLSRAGAFDFLLKMCLYSLHRPEHEEDLPPLAVESDFVKRFRKASQVTGDAGFELIAPAGLATGVSEEQRRILLGISHALQHHPNPADILSVTYENLLPQEVRRPLGQFATPTYLSRFLASWAVTGADDIVLDPGTGAGMLSSAAVREKKQLGSQAPLEDIFANDIDALSISMASVSLKLVDGPGSPSLTTENFLQMSPYTWDSAGRTQSCTVDAVVGNPPYSRSQALSVEEKEKANKIVSRETGIDFHGKSPLYVYFIAHAIQFVRTGGRLSFIIPSGFMETAFGVPFKRYLLEECTIDAIVRLSSEREIFKGVRTTPSLLLLRNEDPNESHTTTFLDVPEWPDEGSISDLVESSENDQDKKSGDIYQVEIAQQLLSPNENWKHYFSPTEVESIDGVCEFRDIATVKRGIATGNNSLFCLSKDEVEQYNLPEDNLKPIIKGAHDIPGYRINREDWESWRDDGRPIWLLYCYDDGEKVTNPTHDGLKEFISKAEDAEEHDRKLCQQRNPWYCVDKREVAPILAKYMSRTGSQFIHNKAGVRTLNNFHNVYPEFGDKENHVKALLAYLNSNIVRRELSKESRSYRGLEKLEVSLLKNTPVIDPRELSPDVVTEMATLFDALETAERKGEDVTPVREKIDTVVEEILDRGVRDDPAANDT